MPRYAGRASEEERDDDSNHNFVYRRRQTYRCETLDGWTMMAWGTTWTRTGVFAWCHGLLGLQILPLLPQDRQADDVRSDARRAARTGGQKRGSRCWEAQEPQAMK